MSLPPGAKAKATKVLGWGCPWSSGGLWSGHRRRAGRREGAAVSAGRVWSSPRPPAPRPSRVRGARPGHAPEGVRAAAGSVPAGRWTQPRPSPVPPLQLQVQVQRERGFFQAGWRPRLSSPSCSPEGWRRSSGRKEGEKDRGQVPRGWRSGLLRPCRLFARHLHLLPPGHVPGRPVAWGGRRPPLAPGEPGRRLHPFKSANREAEEAQGRPWGAPGQRMTPPRRGSS